MSSPLCPSKLILGFTLSYLEFKCLDCWMGVCGEGGMQALNQTKNRSRLLNSYLSPRWRYRRPPWWPTLAMLQLRIGFSSGGSCSSFCIHTPPFTFRDTSHNPINQFSLSGKKMGALQFQIGKVPAAASKLFEVSCNLTQPSTHNKVNMKRCLFTAVFRYFLSSFP